MDQHHTSIGLLNCLQNETNEAWQRLNDMYVPLIRKWLRMHGMGADDAEDISQEVLLVAFRNLSGFHRRQLGSFRCWLRRVTVNCLRDYRRKHWRHSAAVGLEGLMQSLEDPKSEMSRKWDLEHDLHVLNYAMVQVRESFTPQSWAAFQGTAVSGRSLRDVAAELGMTENAVCIAKSRVSASIRKLTHGLLK